ncbi:MAG: YdeI/OmpD-associated family protein [Chloroflexota bacterium]
MTNQSLKFAFQSFVSRDDEVAAGYMKHYISIPDNIADELQSAEITHVEGDVDGTAFRRSLQTRPDGSWCLMFGMTWLKQAGLDVGMEVIVEIAPDPDPNRVDVPDELMAKLLEDPRLLEAWEQLAPSKRKMLGYHIERAKRSDTRERRAEGIMKDLRKDMGINSED